MSNEIDPKVVDSKVTESSKTVELSTTVESSKTTAPARVIESSRPSEMKFLKLLVHRLQSIVLEILGFIAFSFSQKVAFSYFLWFLVWKSGWKFEMSIIAGISTLLMFYIRELQKPQSNMAEILKAWLSHGHSEMGGAG